MVFHFSSRANSFDELCHNHKNVSYQRPMNSSSTARAWFEHQRSQAAQLTESKYKRVYVLHDRISQLPL